MIPIPLISISKVPTPVVGTEFIIEVDTTKSGTSNSNQFEFTGAIGEYDVKAFQSDVEVASFNDLVNQQTITLPSSGIYELRVIPKGTGFDKMTLLIGDKFKLLKIIQWGLYGVNEPNQTNAFANCENITEIAGSGAWFDVVTEGDSMFLNIAAASLPSGMNFPNLFNADSMFSFGSLESLPESMELNNLLNGSIMFYSNSLPSLPESMELPNLTIGDYMFGFNSLTSLPSGMKLPSLESGIGMFEGNTINTERYSQLLIDLEAGNNNNNVEFHGGNSKYNALGEIARNALIDRGWTIIDGGLEGPNFNF